MLCIQKGSMAGNEQHVYLIAARQLNWHVGKAGYIVCAKEENG